MAQVLGGEEFLARVGRIAKTAVDESRKAIRKSAEEHVSVARALSPDKTGELDRSIHIEPGEHDLALRVKVDSPYGMHQELGTQKMQANPYFRPAFRLVKKRARARIRRAFRKAMKA